MSTEFPEHNDQDQGQDQDLFQDQDQDQLNTSTWDATETAEGESCQRLSDGSPEIVRVLVLGIASERDIA